MVCLPTDFAMSSTLNDFRHFSAALSISFALTRSNLRARRNRSSEASSWRSATNHPSSFNSLRNWSRIACWSAVRLPKRPTRFSKAGEVLIVDRGGGAGSRFEAYSLNLALVTFGHHATTLPSPLPLLVLGFHEVPNATLYFSKIIILIFYAPENRLLVNPKACKSHQPRTARKSSPLSLVRNSGFRLPARTKCSYIVRQVKK